jgi:hypothetical protein
MACKAIPGLHGVVGGGTLGRCSEISGETCRAGVTAAGVRTIVVPMGCKSRTGPYRWETGIVLGELTQVPNLCKRQPEKCGVGKPHEGRVVGKWMRNEQKVRQA